MARLVLVVAAALVMSVAVIATAGAGTTTYHGVFAGPVIYKGCTTPAPMQIATGTWNVALHGSTDATVTVDIFVNGEHHVSFGGPFAQVAPEKGQTFAVAVPTLAGPLTVSLSGDRFTYRIAPYDAFGMTCKSVTYNGVLTS